MDWWWEGAKLAIPVVLGLLVWSAQTMAQRAWNEYEAKRGLYQEIVKRIDSLFEGGTREDRAEYLREVRKLWLIGSDEVVRAANALAGSTTPATPHEERERAYGAFMDAMRRDLRTRRWLPPSSTSLTAKDFPVQGA